jgi:regulator of Ty1 transposition protein 103
MDSRNCLLEVRQKNSSAFDVVLNDYPNEDAEISKCMSSVQHMRKMENEVDISCAVGKLSNTL